MIDPKLRRCVVDLRDEVFMLQRLFFDEIARRVFLQLPLISP
jgi:hypothetical protein